jgi:hypothetical protein
MDENTFVEALVIFDVNHSRENIKHKIADEIQNLWTQYADILNKVMPPKFEPEINNYRFSFEVLGQGAYEGEIILEPKRIIVRGSLQAKYKKRAIIATKEHLVQIFHVDHEKSKHLTKND